MEEIEGLVGAFELNGKRISWWVGEVPKRSDLSGVLLGNEFVDGRTRGGPWAIMTVAEHATQGVGLGTGRGQLYRRQGFGDRFMKVEG